MNAAPLSANMQTASQPACVLVNSQVVHARHGLPQHRLTRRTLSVWLDLDRLEQANRQSWLFSVGRFNLLSFYESDFGPNHKSQSRAGRRDKSLAAYARALCATHLPEVEITSIRFLAMPRILGMAFNPITVYLCADAKGQDRFVIYEVHNTFGDSHSYIGVVEDTGKTMLHEVDKNLHVSPFFSMEGHYALRFKATDDTIMLMVRYSKDNKPALTATLRGTIIDLHAGAIMRQILSALHMPMRPWFGIHVEAVKLFLKKCATYRRPTPPETAHSVMTQTQKLPNHMAEK